MATTAIEDRPMRSLLFTPGQRARMVGKALGLPVDAVILDFEDGVPPEQKDDARAVVANAVRTQAVPGPTLLVRINHFATGRVLGDLEAAVTLGLSGVVLPKVDGADEIRELDHLLDVAEARERLPRGSVRILAAIESARGLHHASEIASVSPRVFALVFGAEDFALDLGLPVRRSGPGMELLHARSLICEAAALGRIRAFDQVWLDFHDEAGLRADADAGRQMGFDGKCIIHPAQIETVNAAYLPTQADVNQARQIVSAFDAATADGIGAVMLGGQLVERPIVERAQRTLRAYAAVHESADVSESGIAPRPSINALGDER